MRALARTLHARRRPVIAAAVGVFVVYQTLIAGILTIGLGGLPTYARVYSVWTNARRILALTPSWVDVVVLIGREPLLEYGRRHPTFGAAVWSYELTWSSLVFFLSFSILVGIYLALDALPRGWSAIGSLGGAGIVGMLGASVSSLTHCGLGSFGVLLALAGVSTATIAWFGRVELVLIPAGYGLILGAIVFRAVRLRPPDGDGARADFVGAGARGAA